MPWDRLARGNRDETIPPERTAGNSAALNLHVFRAKNWKNGIEVRLVRSAWNERTVTAATLPAISPVAFDR